MAQDKQASSTDDRVDRMEEMILAQSETVNQLVGTVNQLVNAVTVMAKTAGPNGGPVEIKVTPPDHRKLIREREELLTARDNARKEMHAKKVADLEDGDYHFEIHYELQEGNHTAIVNPRRLVGAHGPSQDVARRVAIGKYHEFFGIRSVSADWREIVVPVEKQTAS